MPTVGHLLFAAPAFRAERLRTHEVAVLLVASMPPDAAILIGWLIGNTWAFHRVLTHSLVFVAAFALVHAIVRRRETMLALGGVASHLALDLLDDGGIPLLWPLTGHHFALGFWRGTSVYDINGTGILRHGNFVADKLCAIFFLGWASWLLWRASQARLAGWGGAPAALPTP